VDLVLCFLIWERIEEGSHAYSTVQQKGFVTGFNRFFCVQLERVSRLIGRSKELLLAWLCVRAKAKGIAVVLNQ